MKDKLILEWTQLREKPYAGFHSKQEETFNRIYYILLNRYNINPYKL
jgi:hypothetical protein